MIVDELCSQSFWCIIDLTGNELQRKNIWLVCLQHSDEEKRCLTLAPAVLLVLLVLWQIQMIRLFSSPLIAIGLALILSKGTSLNSAWPAETQASLKQIILA
jgi:hypothetical protein